MQSYLKHGLVFSFLLHLGHALSMAYPPDSEIYFQEKPLKMMLHIACSSMPSKDSSDACMGCFWRMSSQLQSLKEPGDTIIVSDCAYQYLKSTIYNNCGVALQENLVSHNGTNVTAFCDFDRCIRDVHAKRLISTCQDKVQKETSDPVEAYIKTTSCVLCKTKCLDKKFKMQYEYEPRIPTVSIDVNNMVKLTIKGDTSDKMCNNDQSDELPQTCNCSLNEDEI
ncbi:uncharacterized protein [Anabrus simplex]|uniref:uncharacterized protein n=1 Tax=Anabrus simplex TaxID=316456 RepID=UPI0035A26CBF